MEVKFSSEVIKVENIIYGWYYLIQEVKCSLKKKKKKVKWLDLGSIFIW